MERIRLMRWKYRLMAGSGKQAVKSLLYSFTVLFIVLTFLLYLTVMYDNEVREYSEFGFDYLVLDFDEETLEQLRSHAGTDAAYPARLIRTEVSAETELDVYLVDSWDDENLSFWGAGRVIEGSGRQLSAESLILDVLTARRLGVKRGDELSMTVGGQKIVRRVDRLVKPEFCLNDNIAVCLYAGQMEQAWQEEFPDSLPEYSVLFLRAAEGGKKLDTWLYEEYAGPVGSELTAEERRIYNRSAIVRKEWFREDSLMELQFTPPAALALCVLSIIMIFAFIRHENRKKLEVLQPSFAVLRYLGMPDRILLRRFVILQSVGMTLAGVLAALTVKWLLYDRTLTTYYLSPGLLACVTGCVALTGILLTAAASVRFYAHKLHK